ncbi:MAG: para-aminobenzoate synthetase / 4-amino-4-deoxychorismate lyase, partial [Sphingomonadales bacterium]|nr:para-aminobenzoate synthetase / 4-amino-4-deoxychorismate lyase [Sphingomonadales bacterium]
IVWELDGPTPILKRSKTLETTHLSPDAGGDGPLARFWQAGAPFVLLDDARPDGRSLLYRSPEAVLEARSPQEVRACLARLRAETRHAAGWLAYEAGHALEPKLAPLARTVAPGEPPLLWLGLFGEPEAVDVDTLLPDGAGAWASAPRPRIEREAYLAAVARVREHILDGDVYQANLTFRADVSTGGHPLSLYAALRPRARAGWGGIVFTGAQWILSFSPELFFTLESGHVTARPMKGTAPTGIDPDRLRNDPKQQAENLMIVDLIRNDLSRVSRPGTVQVPELFAVETYPTVLQMTSTVTAGIEDGLGPVDLIEAAFPCGSVTGAPKIRAMELIAELEPDSRGLYTGSIGRVAPGGEAAFNVAIRTLVLEAGESGAVLGLGSGIVADSIPEEEWRECLAKGAFVQTGRRFDLIETMRFDPEEGVAEIERHLARMKGSAEALGFAFDRHDARNELQAATFYLKAPRRLRLLLSRSGALAIESRPLGKPPAEPVRVRIAPLPVEPEDFRLRHKTSDRAFYDEARAAAGVFELLFEDSEGFLTEGSFTSLFVEKEGRLVTPPLTRGLLPGVLRQRLIDQGRALEGELRRDDLGAGFYIGNALRGLIPARLAED